MRKYLVVLLAVALLSACHGVVRQEFDTSGRTVGSMKVGDPALKNIVEIVKAKSEDMNGHLNVQIMLRNKLNRRSGIEWKVVFYDQDGFELKDSWGWRPLNLEPKGTETIEVKSFSKDAVKYELQLQRASMEDLG